MVSLRNQLCISYRRRAARAQWLLFHQCLVNLTRAKIPGQSGERPLGCKRFVHCVRFGEIVLGQAGSVVG